MKAPFPYFGGKSVVADTIWSRLGTPKQYIEPFFGSGAVLLAAPKPASLEVVNDLNGFLANFWRAVKHQPVAVAEWADYPVSHIDLGARHVWMMQQRDRLGAELQDPNWPGDAQVAGWWLWGQCCWIGSGWCDWFSQVPHAGNAGRGVQAFGQVPAHHIGGVCSPVRQELNGFLTSSGAVAFRLLTEIAARLERTRIVHGTWDRCLNHHYGDTDTAVFLDPPYKGFGAVYGTKDPAVEVEDWARDNADLRICLAGHIGDYDLPGWDAVPWKRPRLTYAGSNTTDQECLWFSPACLPAVTYKQADLFGGAA